ncbi:MAG: nucleotide sugar dehydrogenase [Bacteroidota bacterium]|nr:nucleotide sugar dehydrogenase [Bacteroidota bacterium]
MKNYKICIVGLGNVGLDLAITFSKKFNTIGFDINKELIERIKVQKKKYLNRSETSNNKLIVSHLEKLIVDCDIYIVAVPTPVDNNKIPDLDRVIEATKLISKLLKRNNIVIYESTFYPGLTEELCIPMLEKGSKLKINQDFYVGYSPERINIGENKKMSKDIIKITSGSNKIASKLIDSLYSSVIKSGTHCVESIKVAEATKMLENCQRDLNIALMNELSKFFKRINIDTKKVVEAASTKWNFIPFNSGLTGGDCIAVDPYYLIHSAKKNNSKLPLINLARETNEGMTNYVYNVIVKELSEFKIDKLAFFGISYKENCNQTNNSKYLELASKLSDLFRVDIYDHIVEKSNTKLNLIQIKNYKKIKYSAVIIGSKHKRYRNMNFRNTKNKNTIIIDIHGINLFSDKSVL